MLSLVMFILYLRQWSTLDCRVARSDRPEKHTPDAASMEYKHGQSLPGAPSIDRAIPIACVMSLCAPYERKLSPIDARLRQKQWFNDPNSASHLAAALRAGGLTSACYRRSRSAASFPISSPAARWAQLSARHLPRGASGSWR